MWESAVLTNAGRDLLVQWAAGGELTIDKAACGQGTVNEAYLMGQTQLVAQKKLLSIVRRANVAQGVQLQLQCTNKDVSAAFTINQIGVWAHLDNGASVMIAIYQDSTGVLVPTAAEMADYVFTFYATLQMSNTGELTVTIDSSALVSMETFGSLEGEVDDILDGTTTVPKASHAALADNATNATNASNADHADTADNATNANYATSAGMATTANHATSADSATNADHATSADTATSAGAATNATNDGNGQNISSTYSKAADVQETLQKLQNGQIVVGKATIADHATSADTATSAGAATNATNDGNGQNISSTYATKEEVSEINNFDPNGNYHNLTVGHATSATIATNATYAANDGNGNNIANTYATKSELGKLYSHNIYFGMLKESGIYNYGRFFVTIINRSSEQFNINSLLSYLKNNGFYNESAFLGITGGLCISSGSGVETVSGICCSANDLLQIQYIVRASDGTSAMNFPLSNFTLFVDTVVEI